MPANVVSVQILTENRLSDLVGIIDDSLIN
jgi:hypothetical protein